jgi:hypothetical protein
MAVTNMLPLNIVRQILSNLPNKSLVSVQSVHRTFRQISLNLLHERLSECLQNTTLTATWSLSQTGPYGRHRTEKFSDFHFSESMPGTVLLTKEFDGDLSELIWHIESSNCSFSLLKGGKHKFLRPYNSHCSVRSLGTIPGRRRCLKASTHLLTEVFDHCDSYDRKSDFALLYRHGHKSRFAGFLEVQVSVSLLVRWLQADDHPVRKCFDERRATKWDVIVKEAISLGHQYPKPIICMPGRSFRY